MGARRDQNCQLPGGVGKFSFHSVLAERTKAGGVTPQHPLLVAIDNLLGEPLSIKDLVLPERSQIRETVAQENAGGRAGV